jgi:hypothetical protein
MIMVGDPSSTHDVKEEETLQLLRVWLLGINLHIWEEMMSAHSSSNLG